MKRTLLYGIILFLSVSLSGCVCGPYGTGGMYGYNQIGGYSNPCDPCGDPCGSPGCLHGAGYGIGYGVGAVGRGAVHVAATPASWLVQLLRGTGYPCHGCGDEIYWGDYGYVPNDFCDPCTYEGQWGGTGDACGCNTCQRGLLHQYPAVGNYMNQVYSPIFQDKISTTHARAPLNYGLRAPSYDACYDSCSTGYCGTGGYVNYNGGNVYEDGASYEMQSEIMPATVGRTTSSRVASPTFKPVRR